MREEEGMRERESERGEGNLQREVAGKIDKRTKEDEGEKRFSVCADWKGEIPQRG